MGQFFDVESARRDFGRYQGGHLSALEHVEGLDASCLALVAVNGRRFDAGAFQLLSEAVGAMLGTRENQNLMPLTLLDQVHQQVTLLFFLHAIRALFDQFDGRVARRNLNRQRIMQQPLRQAANVVRVGGGEQQVLALLRQQSNDLANVVDKAHVEHAIRFIEDENLNFRQIDHALLREIE